MRKNKLLLLLALLLTAATGAWATDVYVVGNGSDGNWLNGVAWDPGAAENKMTEQNGVYSITYKDVDANSELLFKFAINGSWDVNYGCTSWDANELNKTLSNIDATGGANFKFGLTEKADVTISFNLSEMTYMISTKGMKVGDDAAAGYSVSMKDGVKDADKWTVKVGDGQAQALPIGGLKGDGKETVTLQYNGRLKVKGVKATSDAPAAPASTTLNNTTTAWTAGSYAVPAGGLTYSDAITVSGDVTLTLTDGETLTLNKGISLASGATLTVEGNGTMNVNGTNENTTSTVAGSTGTLILTSGTLTATGGNGGSVDVVENDAHGGNGGVAINGSVIVSGGSLTARGGNGGRVDFQSVNCSGGNGGDAISGSVTVSGGTLTASGGNGGSVGDYGSDCSGGNGGDAISGTLTKNGGSTSVNDGSNGSIGSNCDNCTAGTGGTSDAAPAVKPAATVTTAPTGAAIVGVGKNTALVSGGAADGGTLWYAVTTTNTKPASTDGFSATVPTAETITASGKVYVWYYVKGDDTHSDSEIAGPVSVTVTPALSLTNPVVGQVIGSDGKNYAAASVPSGVTKVAMIAYVSGSNGLAIALADEGEKNWATAKSTCEAKTPAFTNGTWHLPSQAEWNQMFSANGGDEESYNGLNAAINTAGGTTLQSGFYWSSSEYSPGVGAHLVHLDDGDADWSKANEALVRKVRACLAFTVEQAAKPAATVTTAPTGAAIACVGKATALVSGGVADGGTLMYAVTTTNAMPTSTDGFSATVPTAQTVTASGKVYVWYFVKGDDTHSDSEIAATAIEVPVADVVWDATNLSDLYVSGTYASSTIEGITLSGNADQMSAMWNGYGDPTHDGIAFNMNESGGYTFTAPNGKAFTKIVMKPQGQGGWDMANLGTGWTFNADYNEDIEEYIFTVTWKGNAAASTVVLLKDADMFAGETISYIVFYLSDAE